MSGLVVGLVAIRRQGIYFAMITLALAQMVYFVCLQAPFTGGEDGLQGVPRGKLLFGFSCRQLRRRDPTTVMYYVVLAIFVAVFLVIRRIVHSPFGQVLKAIRENEPRAISLGYDVDRYKLLAFVLSTAPGRAGRLAEDAGARLRHAVRRALVAVRRGDADDACSAAWAPSSARCSAPFIVIGLQNMLADKVGSWVTVIIGAIFVVCVVAFRRGFVGELLAWQQRRANYTSGETASKEEKQ